jgi:hypothetical protein
LVALCSCLTFVSLITFSARNARSASITLKCRTCYVSKDTAGMLHL